VLHLIEYKVFEPGTYSTVVPDAGTAADIADSLGDRAGVLIDMGHHWHGANIAQIVARLIGTDRRGGFHFNTRYVADDDHAVEPNLAIYAVFCELVKGGVVCADAAERNWPYMIDQASSLENRIQAVLHSIDSLQVSLAKALILDREQLGAAQGRQDIICANRILLNAFLTDVRPILYMARREKGLPPDPVVAYNESGYQEQIERERA
jgi:L-rhamnose isomerase/sugar isomerase